MGYPATQLSGWLADEPVKARRLSAFRPLRNMWGPMPLIGIHAAMEASGTDLAPPASSGPSAVPAQLAYRRYAFWTGVSAAWVMLSSLHAQIDRLLPASIQLFFYPSFVYFMPLTIWYSKFLPGSWSLDTLPGGMAMSLLDLFLMALICLPFLFPKGHRQTALAAISLAVLVGYTLVTCLRYSQMPGV